MRRSRVQTDSHGVPQHLRDGLQTAPSAIQLSLVVHHPGDVLEHAVKRTGKGELAEMGQPFLHKRCANHGQGLLPLSVRDVFAFEQEKRKSKDMIAVNVGDEHRPQASNIVPGAAKPGEGRGGRVDDVVPVKERKGMVTPVREEGVARSQHLDAVGHAVGTARCFFFSSVALVGAGM